VETGEAAMPRLLARADRIDYWVRRHVVPCPAQAKINPGLDRYVAIIAIGRSLKYQYDALASLIPSPLTALVEQLKMEAHLRPASIVTAVVYSLLLAGGLIAHAMGFPKFSTEPRATPFVSINVPAPLASEDGTIGYR
jgi:hypothetical protein